MYLEVIHSNKLNKNSIYFTKF